MNLTRRKFLATGAASAATLGALPLLGCHGERRFTGGIVGANSALGHKLRDSQLPAPSETTATGIVIVGGGISGLAAARQLKRAGFNDFVLLELESRAGGNAQSGKNEVSAYPWGAHYVPIAGPDLPEMIQLFEELGVIRGRDAAGWPIYEEEYLCADPMERLFIRGSWQEGLVPQRGVSGGDQQTINAFFAEMNRLKSAKGHDGRRAFAIPLDESSRDAEFTDLDKITMAEYLRRNDWLECAPLRWYVNYCCRDDYGAGLEETSAWAGIHYFASREGIAANAQGYAVVTWPEGNGWLVRQLESAIEGHVKCSTLVSKVEPADAGYLVDYYDAKTQKCVRLSAAGVVWAAPQFVARRVLKNIREELAGGSGPSYSPWMVANLTLDALPAGRGTDLAWDNVQYDSRSLGYVVATHQDLHPVPTRTVLTYYQPLDDAEPAAARQAALGRSYDDWCRQILADLSSAHPDLRQYLRNLDVWLWGHAMVRPVPGYIWGEQRAWLQADCGRVVFAHSDMSGISIFEEAYTRGVRAAVRLLKMLAMETRT